MTAPGSRTKLAGPDARARQILNQAVLDVYRPGDRDPLTVPVDRRCPMCGVERDGCDRPMCLRYLSEAEA